MTLAVLQVVVLKGLAAVSPPVPLLGHGVDSGSPIASINVRGTGFSGDIKVGARHL